MLSEVLIVMDMQETYVGKKKRKKYTYGSELIEAVNQRITAYANKKLPVIYIKNSAKGKTPDFADELLIVSSQHFLKEKASCFQNEALHAWLQKNEIKSIEVAGIDGNSCIKFSLLEGAKMEYSLSICLENIGIANKPLFEKTEIKLAAVGIEIR